VVIFVLRLAKSLRENTQRFRSVKVKVTQCVLDSYSLTSETRVQQ